jgi:NAD(P)-dependent dehydrogenase (short-subunit alcohol dehydrogenase family)
VNATSLEVTLARIGASGKDATGVTADITPAGDVDRLVEETAARHGRVDLLANVRGIMDWFLPDPRGFRDSEGSLGANSRAVGTGG